jgi:excisionase family DNA binding protein
VDEGDRRGVDRLTIQEAARRLGVSEGAVRKRVVRGTLEHHKDEDGRIYVYLDAGVDNGVDEGVDPNSNALISQLRDELAYLRDENRRKDEIIMQQAMTMRQLTAAPTQEPSEAPSEARESPESSGSTSELGELREELDTERTRREMAESTLHEGMAEEQRRREEAERERDDLRRELFARREPRESPGAGEEQQGRGQPRSEAPGAQGSTHHPWWRRVFGR